MDLVQSLPSATRMVDLLSSFATAFEQRRRLLKVACDTESGLAADILLPHRLTGSRSGFPHQLLTTEDLLHKAHRLHSRGILQAELDMHLFLVNRNPESREAWRAIRHSSSANQALREKAVTELGRIEKPHTDLQTV